MDPALRRVAEMKPPAKIDGLLQFKKDIKEFYTAEEQKLVWSSEAGRKLGNAFYRCEGHSKQWMETRKNLKKLLSKTNASERESQEIQSMKREVIMKKLKYVDCLAYMVDPKGWNRYTQCWVQVVGSLDPKDLKSYNEHGALDLFCSTQRDSLQREIGALVSKAVQAGDSFAVEEDYFTMMRSDDSPEAILE